MGSFPRSAAAPLIPRSAAAPPTAPLRLLRPRPLIPRAAAPRTSPLRLLRPRPLIPRAAAPRTAPLLPRPPIVDGTITELCQDATKSTHELHFAGINKARSIAGVTRSLHWFLNTRLFC